MFDFKYVGRRVRGWCKDAGITQQELADGLGVPYGTLRSWLYGERRIELEQACAIADYFGKSLDDLACRKAPGEYGPIEVGVA